jgi:hypothetical protein
VILYELMARRLPFTGDTVSVLSRVLLDEPPAPSRFRPDIDPALEAICLKAMAKKSQDRHPSMSMLAAALQDYLRGASPPTERGRPRREAETSQDAATLPPTLPPATRADAEPTLPQKKRPRRGRRSVRRSGLLWLWVGIGAALASVALGLGIVALVRRDRPKEAEAPPQSAPTRPQNVPKTPAVPAFHTLFNGKDLSGWEVLSGHNVWRIEQGELVFHVSKPEQRGWLITKRDYSDFRLRLEFQLSRGANSGVGLRMDPTRDKHIEVQILDDTDPRYRNLAPNLQTGAFYGLAIDRPARLEPLGDWNEMEIEVRGRALRVRVNGGETVKTALDLPEAVVKLNGPPAASGRIGLQHWDGSVWFRKIEVMELPAEGAVRKPR